MPAIRVSFVEPSLAHYRVPFFRALAARPGLDVRLLYADSGRANAAADGFAATFAPRRTWRAFGHPIYWQAAQLEAADASRSDVVSFDWDVHYASLVPALLRARREGVGTILWGHGTSGNDGSWRAWPRFALARLADVLVTYSQTARAMYLARGWPTNRVFCAPNAIDQEPIQRAHAVARDGYASEADAVAGNRTILGLPAAGPVLLFVSRLDAVRRLGVLVDAAAILAPRHPTLRVAIVGDGPERASVAARAAAAGIADRVVFAGAAYDELTLARWYAAADVVVHPAWLGLSVYHSMGHGRPVVTGDDPRFHPPEAASVLDGETGLRFRDGNSAACAAAVGRLLGDAPLRDRLGREARRRAIAEHSIGAMADGFEPAIRAARRRASAHV